MAQHDYNIANGTGSAVRSDLNNALAAIVSMNSGSTEPSTTFAFQFWADTNANLLKMRNSANDGWIELRQLDGEFTTVSVANGTAAAPSIFFNASGTDTGIYSNGTDSVDVSTGGTRRLDIGSAGDVTVRGGNVTLNAQGDLRLADSDSSNWVAFQAPATVASNVTWTLPSADGSNGQSLTTDGSGTLSWTSAGGASITQGNTSAEVVDTGSDGHFKVTTEGTERLRIDNEGHVVAGSTTSRKDWFNFGSSYGSRYTSELSGDNDSLRISYAAVRNSDNVDSGFLAFGKSRGTSNGSATVVQSGDALGEITFQGADGSELVQAASIKVEVDGTPGANDMPGRILFKTTPDGSTSVAERMRITSAGYVGIGTTIPQNYYSKNLVVSCADLGGITLASTNTTNSNFLTFADGTSGGAQYAGWISYTHNTNRLSVGTNANETFAIDNAGNLYAEAGDGDLRLAYVARSWVRFNGTGTVAIIGSNNVSSITDRATGKYTVNFTSAHVNAGYAFAGATSTATNNDPNHLYMDDSVGQAAGTLAVNTARGQDGAIQDARNVYVVTFR